jgi:predicted short-subunit dehydrogenase-like oxidoreductase (DUF2520 family)
VSFIGSGNVAWGLAAALSAKHFELVEVASRTNESAASFAAKFKIPHQGTDCSKLSQPCDLLFLAVPDGTIKEVAKLLPDNLPGNPLVVHCSGATPLKALRRFGPRAGVLWPLQTFTKGVKVSLRSTPLFVECSDERLAQWAKSISSQVHLADSQERLRVHVGAVFVANFPNALYLLAEELVKGTRGLDISVYHPLMREALEKAISTSPKEAQTGPARRHDAKTLERHGKLLLTESKEMLKVYELLSMVIQKRY